LVLLQFVVGLLASLLVTFGLSSVETAAWLAPLIVGGLVAGCGYVLLQKALTALKEEHLAPERTMESLQENKRWLQQKVS
jgi:hypothetical protein